MDAYAYWDILETELQNNSKKRLFLTKKWIVVEDIDPKHITLVA